MKKKTSPINWHSALVSGLKIELAEYADTLTFHTEFALNTGARRIDCLIQRSPDAPPIDSPIGAIFRQYNIVDYKGPSESMSVINFYKVLSYAYSLPDFLNNPCILDETSVTLITHRFPRQLVRHLRMKFGTYPGERNSLTPLSPYKNGPFTKDNSINSPKKNEKTNRKKQDILEKIIPGLYHIHVNNLSLQLVVLSRLPEQDYFWLHCLTSCTAPDFPMRKLSDSYANHRDDPDYQNFMNLIIRASLSKKGSDTAMWCEAIYELFADELAEREAKGEARVFNLFRRLLADGRSEDIERAVSDPAYCKDLMEHYQLH